MSLTYIGAELRRLVVARSAGLCEYCLVAEEDTFFGCEVDHIISEKHGGATEAANLAYACAFCNQVKGSDIGSVHRESGELVRFYNPRNDVWSEHFYLNGVHIEARTAIAAATVRILKFNVIERILERQLLASMKRYPSAVAAKKAGP